MRFVSPRSKRAGHTKELSLSENFYDYFNLEKKKQEQEKREEKKEGEGQGGS